MLAEVSSFRYDHHRTTVSPNPRTTRSRGAVPAVKRFLASCSAALLVGLGLVACPSSTPPTTVEPPLLSSVGSTEASTPGLVVCGPHRCPAGREVCCHFTQGPACVPVSPPNRPYGPAESSPSECEMALNNPPTARVACDDSSDCPDDTRCCVNETGSACLTGLCEAYERCDPNHPACREGICMRGGAPHLSACRIPAGPVVCAELTCPTARPICCLHDDGQRRCVASASDCMRAPSDHRPWGHPYFSFACDGPDDCAPNTPCCAAGRSYQCSRDCPTSTPDGRLPFICTQDEDCPPHPQGMPATCSSLRLLDPSSPPPYVSFCDYEDDAE